MNQATGFFAEYRYKNGKLIEDGDILEDYFYTKIYPGETIEVRMRSECYTVESEFSDWVEYTEKIYPKIPPSRTREWISLHEIQKLLTMKLWN
jgi:hypothetical protein